MAGRIEGCLRAIVLAWTTVLAVFNLYLAGYILALTYKMAVLVEQVERNAIVDRIVRLLF